MDAILAAEEQLEKTGNLSKAVDDLQKIIDLLQSARDAVTSDPDRAAFHAVKIKAPAKQAFEKVEDDLKDVNKALNQYQKALKDKFKNATLSTASSNTLRDQPSLIDRAVAMHLLREGKFSVASAFVKDVSDRSLLAEAEEKVTAESARDWIQDFTNPDSMDTSGETRYSGERGRLQHQFSDMYNILESLRHQHDLGPAIDWAREHSRELESRGSNLEFELSRLKFVELFTASDGVSLGDTTQGSLDALTYARQVFPMFSARYSREISSLLGSLAFHPSLGESPYKSFFYNQDSWEEVSVSFTREFCGMLGLSERSPLYTAVTAGGIALPVLEKVERIMQQTRGQWTSVNELPVETPLPPSYQFHSIFVCPVSKEQATDSNPPMMLPCGHVIAKESLDQHSKGKQRMKCPYCPNECQPREAKRVYI